MKAKVFNMQNAEVQEIELNDSVFAAEYNEALIHEVIVAQDANLRQGTKSALTRSEVRGHAKKPWKQKHTGHARQGSTKGPQFVGGGVVFAPKPRDFSKKVNKKVKELAFKSALSTRLEEKNIIVLEDLAIEAKTKEMVQVLENLKVDRSAVIVTESADEKVILAGRNLEKITVSNADNLSTYEIVSNEKLIITKSAIKKIEEALV